MEIIKNKNHENNNLKTNDFEIKILDILIFIENFNNNNKINEEDIKFLIDSSIVSLFGTLEANKIMYSISLNLKQDQDKKIINSKNNKLIQTVRSQLKAYQKDLNVLTTSIMLVNTIDYKIRFKII